MRAYLTIILIGLVAGFIGILPLVRKKADKYTFLSAFVFYFFMPYIVFNLYLPGLQWWLKGMVITTVMILPLAIASMRGNSRLFLPMIIASIIVGLFISMFGHYLM